MKDHSDRSKDLNTRELWRLFLPLSISDLIMVVAGPLIGAVLGRLPDVHVHLAAYGSAQTLAIVLESPIIMMLHAGNAAATNPAAYRTLGRLMWLLGGTITLLYGAVAFTPAYMVVMHTLLGLPSAVAEAARPAFGVMLLWPASIGFRRYLQGFLIRHRRSRPIMWAGFVRLAVLTGVLLLAAAAGLPGAVVACLGLVVSVMAEAGAVGWFYRQLRLELGPETEVAAAPGEVPTDLRRLFWWYVPLAGTQVLVWLSRPLMTAGIARASLSALSLAAWPVTWSTIGLLANGPRMIQQLTISLVKDRESHHRLRGFALQAGSLFGAILGLLAFTPAADFYLRQVIGLPDDLIGLARAAMMLAVLYPMQVALQNWLQGLLVQAGQTGRINVAAFAGGTVTVGLVFAGARLSGLPGAPLAAGAAVVGLAVELGCLWGFSQNARGHMERLGSQFRAGRETL